MNAYVTYLSIFDQIIMPLLDQKNGGFLLISISQELIPRCSHHLPQHQALILPHDPPGVSWKGYAAPYMSCCFSYRRPCPHASNTYILPNAPQNTPLSHSPSLVLRSHFEMWGVFFFQSGFYTYPFLPFWADPLFIFLPSLSVTGGFLLHILSLLLTDFSYLVDPPVFYLFKSPCWNINGYPVSLRLYNGEPVYKQPLGVGGGGNTPNCQCDLSVNLTLSDWPAPLLHNCTSPKPYGRFMQIPTG